MLFIREIEYKIIIRHLSNDEKIQNFFEIFQISETVHDSALKKEHSIFLDEYLEDYSGSSDEDDY